ncbi:MAG: hypothetical protein MHM6MM_005503, partial [Cercozoa sp. M6MM]
AHKQLTYDDVLQAEIIIVSESFLSLSHFAKVVGKGEHCNTLSSVLKQATTSEAVQVLLKRCAPDLTCFHYHRFVVDEAHEILAKLSTKQRRWMRMTSDFRWLVTATPFPNLDLLPSYAAFLDIRLEDTLSQRVTPLYVFNIMEKLVSRFLLRRDTKKSVGYEAELPDFKEEIVWVEPNAAERAVIESMPMRSEQLSAILHPVRIWNTDNTYLRRFGLRFERADHIDMSVRCRLSELSDIINELKINVTTADADLEKLAGQMTRLSNMNSLVARCRDNEIKSCFSLLVFWVQRIKKYNERMLESLNPRLQKLQQAPEVSFVFLQGGICRNAVELSEARLQLNTHEAMFNYAAARLGSKLATLVRWLQDKLRDLSRRVIVFSQHDSHLHEVMELLQRHRVNCVTVFGNVYRRNNALAAFRGEAVSESRLLSLPRVILFSLKSSAAGADLYSATDICLLDPLEGSIQHVRTQEKQAIGRGARQGHGDGTLRVVRFITRGSVEQQLYELYRESNVDAYCDSRSECRRLGTDNQKK